MDLTWCVNAPTEIQSMPEIKYGLIVSNLIPPEIYNFLSGAILLRKWMYFSRNSGV